MSVIPVTPEPRTEARIAPRSIATPCVKVCIVDGASSLCLGCYRTLEEIGGWSALTDDQRAMIMADLPARRDQIEPAKLGL
jgi:predicted Fe-S protein YdhL (DUF1289 family)